MRGTLFPLELYIWIWKNCSPPTLIDFIKADDFYGSILKSPEFDYIWRTSRLTFCTPAAPAPPPGVSEYEHAHLIWGQQKCFICDRSTNNPPLSYILQIKTCPKPKCYRAAKVQLVPIDYSHIPGPMKQSLVWIENGAKKRLGIEDKRHYTLTTIINMQSKNYQLINSANPKYLVDLIFGRIGSYNSKVNKTAKEYYIWLDAIDKVDAETKTIHVISEICYRNGTSFDNIRLKQRVNNILHIVKTTGIPLDSFELTLLEYDIFHRLNKSKVVPARSFAALDLNNCRGMIARHKTIMSCPSKLFNRRDV
ncbi:hypothetical protein M422DRAFT_25139 [Sphaerobolus stellatus SS14]|nr:hypothetical protein M422DRAFT_25139 [Sphaerobolus stellatus SS14]